MISKALITTASALGLAIGLTSPANAGFRELCGETVTEDTLVQGVAETGPECLINVGDGATLTIDKSFLNITSELRLVGFGSANLEIKDSDIFNLQITIQFQDGYVLLRDNSNIGGPFFPSFVDISSYGDITITGNRFASTDHYTVYSVAGQIQFDNNLLAVLSGRDTAIVSNVGNITMRDNYILGTNLTVQSQSGMVKMFGNRGLDCVTLCQRELQISTFTGAIDVKDNVFQLRNNLSIASDIGDVKVFRNDFGEPSGVATISTAGNCSAKDNSPTLSCP